MSHDEVANLTRLVQSLHDRLDDHDAKMKPIYEGMETGKIMYWFTLKVLGLISAVGGTILLFKQLK